MNWKSGIGNIAFAVVLVLAGASTVLAGGSASMTPATAAFRDQVTSQPSDKVRSDGQYNGFYYNGANCAVSWVNSAGVYFLRTDSFQCVAPVPRSLTVDFSSPTAPMSASQCSVDALNGQAGTLDACGVNQIADARLVAPKMWASAALSNGTSVTILLNLQPDFSNSTLTNATGFEIDFEKNVAVSGTSTSRTLTADANAVADLYVLTKKGNKLLVGRYFMPFSVTVTLSH